MPRLLIVLSLLAAAASVACAQDRFARYDKNGDGMITPDELPRRALFGFLDKNKDGKVTRDELGGGRGQGRGASAQAGRSSGEVPLAEGVKVRRDARYMPASGAPPERTTLDVYYREGRTNAPLLIFVHGGAWRMGDKRQAIGHKANHFVGKGYVVASVNYRLVPHAKAVEQVVDVAKACAWVQRHAGEFGARGERFALMGHSAGAHLVSLLGADVRRARAGGLDPAAIRGVVALDVNTYDIPAVMPKAKPLAKRWYTDAFGEDAAGQREVSPALQLGQHGMRTAPDYLIVVGAEMQEGSAQAETLAAAVRRAGGKAEIVRTDKSHRDINHELGTPGNALTAAVDRFLAGLELTRAPERDQESALDDALK